MTQDVDRGQEVVTLQHHQVDVVVVLAAAKTMCQIRAAMAETIEESDFTSVQRRMQETGLIASEDGENGASDAGETFDETDGSTPQSTNSEEGDLASREETGAIAQRLIAVQ